RITPSTPTRVFLRHPHRKRPRERGTNLWKTHVCGGTVLWTGGMCGGTIAEEITRSAAYAPLTASDRRGRAFPTHCGDDSAKCCRNAFRGGIATTDEDASSEILWRSRPPHVPRPAPTSSTAAFTEGLGSVASALSIGSVGSVLSISAVGGCGCIGTRRVLPRRERQASGSA